MRYPADHRQRTRRRILDSARRQILAHGIEGATIKAILASIGLSHGAFYLHFASKEALLAEIIGGAMADTRAAWSQGIEETSGRRFLAQMIGRYLSPAHRDRAAEGCPIAALGGDLFRQDVAVRGRFEEELRRTLDQLAGKLALPRRGDVGDGEEGRAVALLATLVGTLVLARAVVDETLSRSILRAGRHFLATSLLTGAVPADGRQSHPSTS